MRWTPGGRSADLEDRRGMGGRGFGAGRIGGLGLGGVLLLFILSLVTGQDFLGLLSDPNAPSPAPGGGPVATSEMEAILGVLKGGAGADAPSEHAS